MIMFFRMEAACLIMLLFIATLYFSTKKEKTKIHHLFSMVIITSIAQLVMDIITVYTVNHLRAVPPWLNRLFHQFFFFFLLAMLYYVICYVIALVKEGVNQIEIPLPPAGYIRLIKLLVILAIIFLPIDYMETPYGNYSYGPLNYMAYTVVATGVCILFYLLYKYWSEIQTKKKKAILIVLITEIFVGGYQAFVPVSLISGIGITIIVMGLYLTVESPDAILIEHLRAETKRADDANNAKSIFLANVSHEIRTPINAVLGMDEMILRESSNPDVKKYAAQIKVSAKSLLRIINDILDFTKIESGKMEIIPVEYDLKELLSNIVNMISPNAEKKGLKLEASIDSGLPSKVMGDDIRIRQILTNLLNNAVKYTEQGSVRLKVTLLEKSDTGKTARIQFEIQDTGIGIKEEDLEKLYTAFERVEEKRNRNIEGTGLGVAITTQLLNLMGSTLEVNSVYGEGSTFSFVLALPVIDETPIGDFNSWDSLSLETETSIPDFTTPNAKILVVDDAFVNRMVVCELLKNTKASFTEAEDGEACLELVKKEHFDLIFMDHRMPKLDGLETLQLMKQLEDYPCKDTPVVILTADALHGAREQYLSEGFSDFMVKPIDPILLNKMLLKWLPAELIVK